MKTGAKAAEAGDIDATPSAPSAMHGAEGRIGRISRFVRVGLAALLTVAYTPIAVMHGCRLGSTACEVMITVLCVLFSVILVVRQRRSLMGWLLVPLMPMAAFVVTLGYHALLHSDSFPDVLLDASAREWKAAELHRRQCAGSP